jgi:ATP-binding cassette, subfamily B, multidrug efflux pump
MSMQRANNNPSAGAGRGPRPGGGGGFGPGGGHGMMRGEKARDFKGTMRRLIDYLGPYRLSILVVMIFAAASTVFNIAGPKVLGQATTKLFEGVLGQINGTGKGLTLSISATSCC